MALLDDTKTAEQVLFPMTLDSIYSQLGAKSLQEYQSLNGFNVIEDVVISRSGSQDAFWVGLIDLTKNLKKLQILSRQIGSKIDVYRHYSRKNGYQLPIKVQKDSRMFSIEGSMSFFSKGGYALRGGKLISCIDNKELQWISRFGKNAVVVLKPSRASDFLKEDTFPPLLFRDWIYKNLGLDIEKWREKITVSDMWITPSLQKFIAALCTIHAMDYEHDRGRGFGFSNLGSKFFEENFKFKKLASTRKTIRNITKNTYQDWFAHLNLSNVGHEEPLVFVSIPRSAIKYLKRGLQIL